VLTKELTDAAEKISQSNEFRSKLEPLGVIGKSLAGKHFVDFQRKEILKWSNAARASGITLQWLAILACKSSRQMQCAMAGVLSGTFHFRATLSRAKALAVF